jgi:hypothetical protein
MANSAIMDAIAGLWSEQNSAGRRILDLACGRGTSTRLLTDLGYCVTATDYRTPPPLPAGVDRIAGVDSNHFSRFIPVSSMQSIWSKKIRCSEITTGRSFPISWIRHYFYPIISW